MVKLCFEGEVRCAQGFLRKTRGGFWKFEFFVVGFIKKTVRIEFIKLLVVKMSFQNPNCGGFNKIFVH